MKPKTETNYFDSPIRNFPPKFAFVIGYNKIAPTQLVQCVESRGRKTKKGQLEVIPTMKGTQI